jgi:hypothetical protein
MSGAEATERGLLQGSEEDAEETSLAELIAGIAQSYPGLRTLNLASNGMRVGRHAP